MSISVIIIVALIGGVSLGLGFMYMHAKADHAGVKGKLDQLTEQNTTLIQKIETAQVTINELNNQLAGAEKDVEHLAEKLKSQLVIQLEQQEKMELQFASVASKILADNSQKFSEQNKESMQHILNPLKEKISEFEKRVESTNKDSIDMHATLRQQISGLRELNEQMSKEALNLTKALKGDSKIQGNWGELVLERVLEKSGLEKGREYEVQQSFTLEDGSRVLPDVIINLPDGKKMIVDSKVSLTAYEQYVNSEEEDQQAVFLKAHIESIKKHVEGLGNHNYHDLYQIESPDFVLMFIPIEPAFAIAVNQDNQLYNKAFDKNIVIVTPSTLLATLRTIDTMWSNDKQQRNALVIAQESGKLYDQFTNLIEDLVKVGNQLGTVQRSYESSMKKLTGKGNLISKVEKLKKLGAKANKSLPDNIVDRAED